MVVPLLLRRPMLLDFWASNADFWAKDPFGRPSASDGAAPFPIDSAGVSNDWNSICYMSAALPTSRARCTHIFRAVQLATTCNS